VWILPDRKPYAVGGLPALPRPRPWFYGTQRLAWRQAVAQATLSRPQVVDTQGGHGPISPCYELVGVPATFLLDSAGRIVARDLRSPVLSQALNLLLR
jgi:hypothetical protein